MVSATNSRPVSCRGRRGDIAGHIRPHIVWNIRRDAARTTTYPSGRPTRLATGSHVTTTLWSTSNDEISFTAHVTLKPGDDRAAVRREIEKVLKERFGIHHTTIQVESEAETHEGAIFHR